MPLPHAVINGQKITPFKYFTNQPYGAFVNTTPIKPNATYPIKQTVSIHNEKLDFNWPSSEMTPAV